MSEDEQMSGIFGKDWKTEPGGWSVSEGCTHVCEHTYESECVDQPRPCRPQEEHEYAPGTRFFVVEIPPEATEDETDFVTQSLVETATKIESVLTNRTWDLFCYRQHNAPPANVPAASEGLREALEKHLETLPVLRYDNGYPTQALPKAALLSLLAKGKS